MGRLELPCGRRAWLASIMPTDLPKSDTFLSHLGDVQREQLEAHGDLAAGSSPDALEATLARAWQEVRDAWPGVDVEVERYLAHVASKLDDISNGLDGVRWIDLYIARACADGSPAGIEALERSCFSAVDGALARMGVVGASRDEAKQRLREVLFVGKGGMPAKVANYSGRGDLQSWVCVVAVRTARKMNHRRESEVGDEALADLQGGPDPELDYLKRRYRAEFKEAFGEAMSKLSRQHRILLRHHYLDRLSIDEIGSMYQMHRSTAARQINRAREALVGCTRGILGERLRVTDADIDSIGGMIQSQIELSLERYLKETVELEVGRPGSLPGDSTDEPNSDEPNDPDEPNESDPDEG